ncbi:MAG: hypothetical protein AAF212_07540 [Verrucomicrobiota bacterium]
MITESKIFLHEPSQGDAARLGWAGWFEYLCGLPETVLITATDQIEGPGSFISFSPIESPADCYASLEGKVRRILAIDNGEYFIRNLRFAFENRVDRVVYPTLFESPKIAHRASASVWSSLYHLPSFPYDSEESNRGNSEKMIILYEEGRHLSGEEGYRKIELINFKERLNRYADQMRLSVDWFELNEIEGIDIGSYSVVVFDVSISIHEALPYVRILSAKNVRMLFDFEFDILDSLMIGDTYYANLSNWRTPPSIDSVRGLLGDFTDFVRTSVSVSECPAIDSKRQAWCQSVRDYGLACLKGHGVKSRYGQDFVALMEDDQEFAELTEWLKKTYSSRGKGYDLLCMIAFHFFDRFPFLNLALDESFLEERRSLIEKLSELLSLTLSTKQGGSGVRGSAVFNCWCQLLLTKGGKEFDLSAFRDIPPKNFQGWLQNKVELALLLRLAYESPPCLSEINNEIATFISGNNEVDMKSPLLSAWASLFADGVGGTQDVYELDTSDFDLLPQNRIIGRITSAYLCSDPSKLDKIRADCMSQLMKMGLLKYPQVERFFSRDLASLRV